MKIAICASMTFAAEIFSVQKYLEGIGCTVYVPHGLMDYLSGALSKENPVTVAQCKIANDLIRRHYKQICQSDAALILNYDKNGVKNYIGGNTLLEMGFAFTQGKRIFCLNGPPDIDMIKEEILAMQPVVLYGDLNNLMGYFLRGPIDS